jgi:hypothetical protein
MAGAEQRNHASAFLRKAEEYLAASQDNLGAERHTVAAGDAIHAGISAKDAIVTVLTGVTRKGKDHAAAAKELRIALGTRADASAAKRPCRNWSAPKRTPSTALLCLPPGQPNHLSGARDSW